MAKTEIKTKEAKARAAMAGGKGKRKASSPPRFSRARGARVGLCSCTLATAVFPPLFTPLSLPWCDAEVEQGQGAREAPERCHVRPEAV
jgi:hypothetical protein